MISKTNKQELRQFVQRMTVKSVQIHKESKGKENRNETMENASSFFEKHTYIQEKEDEIKEIQKMLLKNKAWQMLLKNKTIIICV